MTNAEAPSSKQRVKREVPELLPADMREENIPVALGRSRARSKGYKQLTRRTLESCGSHQRGCSKRAWGACTARCKAWKSPGRSLRTLQIPRLFEECARRTPLLFVGAGGFPPEMKTWRVVEDEELQACNERKSGVAVSEAGWKDRERRTLDFRVVD